MTRSTFLGFASRKIARVVACRERGQAVVEFALIVPLLVLLTMGMVDFGRVFYSYEALANAAREGARYCALNPGNASGTQSRVNGEVNGTVASVTASGCTNQPRGQPVTVTVTAPFAPVTPLICTVISCDPGNTITVRAEATMVVW
jgi:Flp pilus assembly protein TadG